MSEDPWKDYPVVEGTPRITVTPDRAEATDPYSIYTSPGVTSPAGSTAPQVETAGDPQTIAMRGINQAGFGMPNRFVAAKRALTGDSPGASFSERYDRALQDLDKSQRDIRQEYPWTTGFTDAAAGAASGVGLARGIGTGVTQGRNLAGRMAAGAGEGALLGGLQGAGTTYSGIPSDYAQNFGLGSIFGAGVGGVAPAVGQIGGAAYRAAANRGWGGGYSSKITDAAQADAAGLHNLANVPGSMLPDAGPSMRGVAQGAVTGTGGPGRTALVTALTERDAGTGRRIVGDIDQTFGPVPPPPRRVDADIQGRMSEMGPAYDAALNNARAIDNTPLARHLETQIINERGPAQAALRQVRAMLDVPTNPGVLDPHPRAMQATREAVRGMRDDPATDDNTRRVLRDAYDRLTQEMQAKIPGIRELDHQYAELGSQRRAAATDSAGAEIFDTGRGTVLRPVEAQQVMTEGARPKGVNVGPSAEAFRLREATRSELDRIVGANKNDLAKLESVLGQPQDWNQQKLAIMFGPERARALMDVLARERNFRQTYQDVVQGPQTAQRIAAKESLDAGGGKIPADVTAFGTLLRTAQAGVDALRTRANQGQRDAIAQLMATRDPATIQALVRDMLATAPSRDQRQAIVQQLIERGMIGGAALAPSVVMGR